MRQGVGGGGLTLDVTEKFATEAMNLLAQPVRGGAQNHDVRSQPTGKPADKEVLRGYVEHMVEEKLAGQRKQTPHKTRPPRGGQGAGAKRELDCKKMPPPASHANTVVECMWANAGINQVVRKEIGPSGKH